MLAKKELVEKITNHTPILGKIFWISDGFEFDQLKLNVSFTVRQTKTHELLTRSLEE